MRDVDVPGHRPSGGQCVDPLALHLPRDSGETTKDTPQRASSLVAHVGVLPAVLNLPCPTCPDGHLSSSLLEWHALDDDLACIDFFSERVDVVLRLAVDDLWFRRDTQVATADQRAEPQLAVAIGIRNAKTDEAPGQTEVNALQVVQRNTRVAHRANELCLSPRAVGLRVKEPRRSADDLRPGQFAWSFRRTWSRRCRRCGRVLCEQLGGLKTSTALANGSPLSKARHQPEVHALKRSDRDTGVSNRAAQLSRLPRPPRLSAKKLDRTLDDLVPRLFGLNGLNRLRFRLRRDGLRFRRGRFRDRRPGSLRRGDLLGRRRHSITRSRLEFSGDHVERHRSFGEQLRQPTDLAGETGRHGGCHRARAIECQTRIRTALEPASAPYVPQDP
mgnify:CR=1 FL=1